MSDKVQGWVWDLDLLPARKLVLLWLAGRATDNGVAFPGEREIRERTGLCERMVRYHLQWLASDLDDSGQPKRPLVMRVERRVASRRNTSNVYVLAVPWQEPNLVRRDLEELQHVTAAAIEATLRRVGATDCAQGSGGNGLPPVGAADCPEVGATGCPQESSPKKRHRNTPQPPTGAQQQGEAKKPVDEPAPGLLVPATPNDAEANALVAAFYRGLGMPVDAATSTIRQREVVIACQLVKAGASQAEAEAYAQEARATPGRIAPVDLRSYERERLSWLARTRLGSAGGPRLVDRTGQPPHGTWRADRSSAAPACRSADPESSIPTSPGQPKTTEVATVIRRLCRASG
jgi:hypothetical protein